MVIAYLLGLGVLAGSLQPQLPATLSNAEVIFEDHFEGNSGGVPANWNVQGEGSVVETGSSVLLDGNCSIWTAADFDPNQSPVTTVITEITSTDDHVHVGFINFANFDQHIWLKLHAFSGKIELKASDVFSAEEEIDVGFVSGYDGGPIVMRFVMTPSTFSVATNDPPYFSGPIRFDSVFTTFARDSLGTATRLLLENECSPGTACTSVYDRVAITAGQATTIDRVGFGALKVRFGS